ncbi:P-loop containing nucleoside triphosphate hydrolases superfamily protein [Prunus dulcis]|uniref:P-loop containing nucleoside triphosphate hydrolases superfamily protein n=1 Tax=Prunus dulcis TaxID=3755 RepID=A0A4Y1RCP8_PRUDU|nr:P-loop containing nucleoside triphosphate hydrolases superfamily protein [Prunus dulcis]
MLRIILDVPTVGGPLMLVDMAGSENIEQAGQIGFEAKMQTAKINQGNIALKKWLNPLPMDSFEDDKTKILMVLCASPDPEEIHKTISTLEYGAKAKCTVRGPHTLIKDKIGTEDSSAGKKLQEKERKEAHRKLQKKEEVAALRAKLELMEGTGSGKKEEEINLKVTDRELEKKLEECQPMANEFVELERRRMEERILQQQQEAEMLRRRLEEIELELCRSGDGYGKESGTKDHDGTQFAKRLLGIYASDDAGGMLYIWCTRVRLSQVYLQKASNIRINCKLIPSWDEADLVMGSLSMLIEWDRLISWNGLIVWNHDMYHDSL